MTMNETIQKSETEMMRATAATALPDWALSNHKVVALCGRDPAYRANVIILGKYAEWRAMFINLAEVKP